MWVRAPLTVSVCQCQPLPTLLHASVIHASCLRQLDWGNLPASVTVSTRCFTHTYASILTAVSAAATTRRTHPAGPWPAEATQVLPPGYVALAESCWARQRTMGPVHRRCCGSCSACWRRLKARGAHRLRLRVGDRQSSSSSSSIASRRFMSETGLVRGLCLSGPDSLSWLHRLVSCCLNCFTR